MEQGKCILIDNNKKCQRIQMLQKYIILNINCVELATNVVSVHKCKKIQNT